MTFKRKLRTVIWPTVYSTYLIWNGKRVSTDRELKTLSERNQLTPIEKKETHKVQGLCTIENKTLEDLKAVEQLKRRKETCPFAPNLDRFKRLHCLLTPIRNSPNLNPIYVQFS